MLTKEQFEEWKEHPVTKEIFDLVKDARRHLLENFSRGLTLGSRADETHGLTHKLVGQIEGLNQLLSISFDDEEEDKEEEEI